jgi:hypothetical protein
LFVSTVERPILWSTGDDFFTTQTRKEGWRQRSDRLACRYTGEPVKNPARGR